MDDETKNRLIEHLRKEWEQRWAERKTRPKEVADSLFGPSYDRKIYQEVHELYFKVYMEGAVDILEIILSFDEDVRGVEALTAILKNTTAGEG